MSYQRVPGEDPYEEQSQAHWQNLPSNPAIRSATLPTPSAPPSTSSSHTVAPSAPHVQETYREVHDVVAPLIPEDAPPSYEATVAKDIPQIHDNYDHLRGPRAVRGIEDKTRIPLDSTPYFGPSGSTGGAGSSSSGAGSSSTNAGPSVPRNGSPAYGSFQQQQQQQQQQQRPHSQMAQPSAPRLPELGRRGQIALDPDSPVEETNPAGGARGGHSQEADIQSYHSDESDDHDDGCWSSVSEPRPWFALLFHVIVILPWAIFCQAWVLCVGIISFVSLIIPPIGYFLIIPAVTSWRALARADLVMSELLVSNSVRLRYGSSRAKYRVFVAPEPINTPPWHLTFMGTRIPIPAVFQTWRQQRAQRRSRGVWKQGVRHLKDTIKDRHTIKSFFYFAVGKFMLALFIFVVIVCFLSLSIPFMLCLLPTLLKLSTKFANLQYRWALTWLTEKSLNRYIVTHAEDN
ncbi:hypothetical protein BGZ73_004241 [Actinomortierella ambigua]|nr:hypothetical protein BGZ73_004241 [Actinomortierella ambigua]